MAYAATNPPVLTSQGIAGPKVWIYSSTDDVSTVTGASYFTNGDDLGMSVGDAVWIYDTDGGDGGVAFVTAVTAGGAATVAESQAVTS